MKEKWMDIEAKVWFIEQNGSIKMDSTVLTSSFCYLSAQIPAPLFSTSSQSPPSLGSMV
jgi:hypothetical protein